jgi:hypothetical protein
VAELKETVEVTTPVTDKKVTLRGYTTARISQEVEKVYLKGAKASGDTGTGKATIEFDPALDIDASNKAIELMVISIEGQGEKSSLDYILNDLPEDDFNFIKAEVNRISRPLVKKTDPA